MPPTLVLPVDKTVTFKLHSPDVIHDFGVPGFLEKMDVIPGPKADDNQFSVTPTVEGTYRGKCYELCGVYHSRMLFNVKIVSEADYEAYLHACRPRATSPTSRCSAASRRRRRPVSRRDRDRSAPATTPSTATTVQSRVGRSARRSSRSSPPPTTR